MKTTKDQQRVFGHLREHGTPRGMTLGRGRPHDRRVIQSLIELYLIKPIFGRSDVLQDEYAIRGEEDQHGLALLECYCTKTVVGATHYGVRVRPFDATDYDRDTDGSAIQNGIDTAWECYPGEHGDTFQERREWMQWSVARSTLEMRE